MLLGTHRNIAERLISFLATSGASHATNIHAAVEKSGQHCTIQAIYKELRNLQSEGVIIKTSGRYSLSLPWAVNLAHFSTSVVTALTETSTASYLLPESPNSRKKFTFTTLGQADDFWVHAILLILEHSSNQMLFNWLPHPWFHLVNGKKAPAFHAALKERKYYLRSIIGGNSFLDKRSKKLTVPGTYEFFYRKSPFEEEDRVYYSSTDRFLITLRLLPTFANELDLLYERNQSAKSLDLATIAHLTSESTKIVVTIDNSKARVRKMWNKFIDYFEVSSISRI